MRPTAVLVAVFAVTSAGVAPAAPADPSPGAAALREPGAPAGASVARGAAGVEALRHAFRFASAIESDPKDRGQAQEAVALDAAVLGALDEAGALAGAIDGWRRGVALAEIAAIHAREGRAERARALIAAAETVRDGVDGWQNPRIAAHVAQALALLGEVERSRRLAAELAANDRQYAGRPEATLAAAHAARGEFEAAVAALAGLDGRSDFDAAWWHAAGYLSVARQPTLPRARRLEAAEAARAAAERIPGWQKAEMLSGVGESFVALERPGRARRALQAAESAALPLRPALPVRSLLLADLARARARLGDSARARMLLEQAAAGVPDLMMIERPAARAWVAAGWSAIDIGEADRLFDRALREAGELRNSRPRALAAVEICRALARTGRPLSEPTRDRLEALLEGLGEPW
jgi:hypothetical protein